jgi:deazaflavin-dependent oxidoreductase (nitroreductase family)
MPAPRWLARFNARVTNNITRPFASDLPGLGVVVHIGRKTQQEYRTPVNVFRSPKGFVIALTYGPNSEWVRNILASRVCTLETRGRRWRLVRPQVVHDEQRRLVPLAVGIILRLVGVSDFLTLDVEMGNAQPAPPAHPA